MSSQPNSSDTAAPRREDLSATADAIVADFRRLVTLLDRTADMLKGTDEEFVAQLCATKAVAERGLRLGSLLSRMARRK